VFETIVRNAVSLCGSQLANVFCYDGELIHWAASHSVGPSYEEMLRAKYPMRPDLSQISGRVLLGKSVVWLEDVLTDPDYDQQFPKALCWRRVLGVPMLRDGEPLGVIVVAWSEPGPVSKIQEELLKTFADQAVIAIENVRLFDEVEARTRELSEALDWQTATSEVLGVISSSPGELEPVFNAMLENAIRICGAQFGNLFLREGDAFRAVAVRGPATSYVDWYRQEPLIELKEIPDTPLWRLAASKQLLQVSDLRDDQGYLQGNPRLVALVESAGARSILGVPLLKENDLVGAFFIYRLEVQPFAEKHIELLSNFAKQAVIAIENVRLLNELRESLQQQTATADVLKVISRSTFDLQVVLDALVVSAARLCEADTVLIGRPRGETYHFEASYGVSREYAEYAANHPPEMNRGTVSGRVLLERKIVQVADVRADPEYTYTAAQKMAGYCTLLGVPLLREGSPIGVIALGRNSVRPFTERQIELATTFADQAVIAIENVRLFDEVQARTVELTESLQEQTATADVLKVISRSAFDLKSVLETLVESAARLCDADKGTITRQVDGVFYRAESYGFPAEVMERWKNESVIPERGSAAGRALLEGRTIHIPDADADPDYTFDTAGTRMRSMLGVPMLREGVPIGVLSLARSDVRPFTDKQIDLVSTFADQAAIAIENVRLFEEIEDKSRQLADASQHKSQFLANMSHELRTPLNAVLGYTELMADGVYGAPPEKMSVVLKRIESNGKHLLSLINAVLDLSKIEAGQLKLDLADYSLAIVVQVQPLAADKKLTFKTEVTAKLPPGHGDERRLIQVLLNLVANAIKFTDAGEVVIKAAASDDLFALSVSDTGAGISTADQAKLFQQFQQVDNSITRKKGGTGLGLAISKRIVEMHGGKIWLESKVGEGSTFFVTLPVRAEQRTQ
jgi:signal transduction histidine kinase